MFITPLKHLSNIGSFPISRKSFGLQRHAWNTVWKWVPQAMVLPLSEVDQESRQDHRPYSNRSCTELCRPRPLSNTTSAIDGVLHIGHKRLLKRGRFEMFSLAKTEQKYWLSTVKTLPINFRSGIPADCPPTFLSHLQKNPLISNKLLGDFLKMVVMVPSCEPANHVTDSPISEQVTLCVWTLRFFV